MKYTAWVLAAITGLLLLLCILVYLPPVQRFVKNKASEIVAENMGLNLTIDRFRLYFPLSLEIDNTALATFEGDTLIGLGRLRADVALWPLLRKEVRVARFYLNDLTANLKDTTNSMILKGRAGELSFESAGIRLNKNILDIGDIRLSDADINIALGESHAPADTSASGTALWDMSFGNISLERVSFGMDTSPEITTLKAILQKAEVRDCGIDLEGRSISAASVLLDRGEYKYLTDTTTLLPHALPDYSPHTDTLPPWVIRLGMLELKDNALEYGVLNGSPSEGFDPDHISIDGLNLNVSSVYNRGANISAVIEDMALRERSGLEITDAEGRLAIDSAGVRFSGFRLETPESRIRADIDAGTEILAMNPNAPVSVRIDSDIAVSDIFLFYPAGSGIKNNLSGKHLTIDGNISGTLGSIDIASLSAELQGHAKFSANGTIASLTGPSKLSGNLHVNSTMTDIGFVKYMLPDTSLQRRIDFPKNISLNGNMAFSSGIYSPDLRISADTGRIDIKGRLDLHAQNYDLSLNSRSFPLYRFLPADSLGLLTAGITATGKGFDPAAEGARADIKMDIGRFDYKGYDYSSVSLTALLDNHKLSGQLTSGSEALKLGLMIDGELYPGKYGARVSGRLDEADLNRMRLSEIPAAFAANIDLSAEISPDTMYKAEIALDSVRYTQGTKSYKADRSTINAFAGKNNISAAIRSGDLALDIDIPAGIDSLTAAVTRMAAVAQEQVRTRSLNMAELQQEMPPIRLDMQAGQRNMLYGVMKGSGIEFSRLSVTAESGAEPLKAGMVATGIKTAGMVFDTLNLGIAARDERLNYFIRLANRPENNDLLALVYLYGNVANNVARANFVQRNRNGDTGFRFGLDAQLLDSAVRVSLLDNDPILAYAEWSVNEGNHITYSFNKELSADLRLENGGRFIGISSVSDGSMPAGSVRAELNNIEIASMLAIMPVPPPVSGNLSADISLGIDKDFLLANGDIRIKDASYDKNRIGDVGVSVGTTNNAGKWDISGVLSLDERTALSVQGEYNPADSGNMDVTIDMQGLRLDAANAFIPPDALALGGTLTGKLNASGSASRMSINGEFGFEDGKVTVPVAGTTYGISPERIELSNSRLTFDDFGLTAPNKRKLSVDGIVDMSDFSRLSADLSVSTSGFEAVNSSRGGGSPLYGKAFIDADITAKGPLDALAVRGGIRLLSNTDVTYTLTDSPLETTDMEQHIVKFVSFADSAAVAYVEADSSARVRLSGMDALLNVDIDNGVQATLNLSLNGNNRIELVGGGNLTYSMNTQGDTRLSGRYTLTGGTVVYTPPVISEKNFAISDGSYVEWTGDMLDPSFNIRAVEKLRTNVTMEGEDPRNVTFDVSVSITNSLNNMAVIFDLAAPSDAAIQNQLSSLAPEQRSSQAMALLIYNTYTGPRATGKVDVDNPLNTFISKELNQWARNNIKWVDLSVGIHSVDEASGDSHTDYSYRVSKSLFNDRVKVSIGGSVSDNTDSESVKNNFVDDISVEYRLTKRDNMFLKAYRYNTQESILEGEVVETGGGFVVRKKMDHLKELFRLTPDPEKKKARREKREQKRRSKKGGDEPAGQPESGKKYDAMPPETTENTTGDE